MDDKERMELIALVERHWRDQETERQREVRAGWWMAVFLVVGTILEYGIAVTVNWNLPVMVAINIAEAAAIMVYFMHLPKIFGGGHAGEED
jgi:cobalamin biosynthesis protein CobD/CbiB